ncbi:hypothetical protein TUM4438_34090 [Shewanella sairae]|uniref:Tol-Pal system protein TolQ n=1 Tax=Shewanella sairae TaxID=190310 RepID=A0ABQ4PN00_9GAMM|nr:hypothetical protein TUM4438_34090 [Shewanella sairae]
MFRWPISVYYEDTDAGGVVYHSNYLNFFERARTEWLRALGVSQTALLAEDTAFVVKRAELDFCKAARFEQNLIVETKVIQLKKASMVFQQRLIDENGVVYCEADVLVACIALSRMRPKPFPKILPRSLKVEADISFIGLFLQASLLVKFVMLTLLVLSIASWAVILQRRKLLTAAKTDALKFEDKFWSGVDLNKLYQELSARQDSNKGLEALFVSGFKEYARLNKLNGRVPEAIMDGSYRAMRVSLSRELEKLETHLPLLATIGSTSPYIGLFGTVWGIMNSFIALGAVENATLAMVAPGIAEALIATAMGLFAAIPAVIAYNRFSTQVEKIEMSYANFMEEFSSILHRQAYSEKEQA